MIIGNGLIANALKGFKDNPDVLIFASGVSDSSETQNGAFQREFNLIKEVWDKNSTTRFIYISTCSIYDNSLKNSPYLNHKLAIEQFIQERHSRYLILRLPNMVGPGGNPKTMVNFFVDAIRNQHKFKIQKSAFRNLMDCQDLEPALQQVIQKPFHNEIINIANPENYRVSDIVKTIEKHLKIKSDAEFVEGGGEYWIDLERTKDIMQKIRKDYSLNYLNEMLNKYIQH